MTFEQTIARYIDRHGLLRHDGLCLVALSGGADSVALLRVLLALGYRVEAMHCNFHLRGDESERDEQFCVGLCAALGVGLHRAHFDTTAYAALHGVSIEMAARELRYRYFDQLRRDLGAEAVCVAHHRDDQLETVLLNLVRGTGLAGLQGMHPRNGHVVRPLLGVARAEVEAYLRGLGQAYVTDSTNLTPDVQRNRLRLGVIPQLEALNPAVRDNVCRMAENLGEAAKVVAAAMADAVRAIRTADGGYDLVALGRQPSPSYVLWHIVGPHGFRRAQMLEMLAHHGGGAQWASPSCVALIDRARLYIYNRCAWEQPLPTLRMPEAGTYVYALPAIDALGDPAEPSAAAAPACAAPLSPPSSAAATPAACAASRREARFRVSLRAADVNFAIDRSPLVAQLDAALVAFPLTVRPVRGGDRFMPFGMRGTKLVADFLADRKLPPLARHLQLAVCAADGTIVWLVGQRIDHRFALRPGHTRRVLRIEMG